MCVCVYNFLSFCQFLSSPLPPSSVLQLMLYSAQRSSSQPPQPGQLDILENLYSALMMKASNTSLSSESEETSSRCLLFSKVLWLKADSSIQTGKVAEARDCLVSCLSFIDHVISLCTEDSDSASLLEFKVCDSLWNDSFNQVATIFFPAFTLQ